MKLINSRYKLSNSQIRNFVFLVLLSLLTSHLTDYDYFSDDETYNFPWVSTITSILIGTVIGFIADFNFKYYKVNIFTKTISPKTIANYFVTTLGYITICYIPFYFVAIFLADESFIFYYLLVGLLITLLLSSIAIAILYGEKLYKIHKKNINNGKLAVTRNGKTTMIDYSKIAYFYSTDKIVSIITTDQKSITSDFTLQNLEKKLASTLFFRANRQVIIHARAVDKITPDTNGKLSITLQPNLLSNENSEIIISRYKKKEFIEWFDNQI
ncbi:LytR/AlgR family response regulator transcription factor [Tenacibaculum sp. M341]|uniref:LytR/AlgR family response regulator transcription factor n=1 Tax=Tenacibaculum sp. M341 TaxID=2530339 RepID=UPI00104E89CD|nr:LytTR family DNA-binding domain-containing protein [Tenacibaculum sp. M341]TCI93777.1 LytTR family transcriptional regulator [Tenacibaculum sp. M341]